MFFLSPSQQISTFLSGSVLPPFCAPGNGLLAEGGGPGFTGGDQSAGGQVGRGYRGRAVRYEVTGCRSNRLTSGVAAKWD